MAKAKKGFEQLGRPLGEKIALGSAVGEECDYISPLMKAHKIPAGNLVLKSNAWPPVREFLAGRSAQPVFVSCAAPYSVASGRTSYLVGVFVPAAAGAVLEGMEQHKALTARQILNAKADKIEGKVVPVAPSNDEQPSPIAGYFLTGRMLSQLTAAKIKAVLAARPA